MGSLSFQEIKESETDHIYTGYHRLISVTVDGTETSYQYDGDDVRVATVKDGITIHHEYAGGYIIAQRMTEGEEQKTITYARGLEYISRQAEGTLSYYFYNAHGDVVQTANEDGTIENRYEYDIFGETTLCIEAYENPFQYSGEYYDSESGNIYLRARYYNPETARFLTQDSYLGQASTPATLNRYTYCANDPVNYVDPSGHLYEGPEWEAYVEENMGNPDCFDYTIIDKITWQRASSMASAELGDDFGPSYGIRLGQLMEMHYRMLTGNANSVEYISKRNNVDMIVAEAMQASDLRSGKNNYGAFDATGKKPDTTKTTTPLVGYGGTISSSPISDETRDAVIQEIASTQGISYADATIIFEDELQKGSLSQDANGVFSALSAKGVVFREVSMFIGQDQVQLVTFEKDRNYGGLREMVDLLYAAGINCTINYDPATNISTLVIENKITRVVETIDFDINASAYQSKTDEERGWILRDDRIMVGLQWIAEKAGLEDTLSWWSETTAAGTASYAMLQPDMLFSPVKVTRAGNDVTIKVYRQFSGSQANASAPGGGTYSDLADEGFRSWGGKYNWGMDAEGKPIFLNASVELIGSDPILDPLGQKYIDVSIRTIMDDVMIDPITGAPMTMTVTDPSSPYIGQTLPLSDPKYREYTGRGFAYFGLNPPPDINMFLYTEWAGDLVPDPNNPGQFGIVTGGKFRDRDMFIQHAWHELGHTLGIEDAYANPNNNNTVPPYYLSPDYDIMQYNYAFSAPARYVNSNNLHMAMILNASRYREWQEYSYYDTGGKYATPDGDGSEDTPVVIIPKR